MKKRKSNLKGTVLFTTVSIMALLILFLMGTLTLASASNNRAHKTYSSSQANYTARAAIDGFLEAVVRDEKVEAAVINVGKTDNSLVAKLSINEPSLGHIGYVDSTGEFHEGEILVEKVPDTPETKIYEYLDSNNGKVEDKVSGSSAKWVQVERVKITASARVGKEYETVVAYVNKLPGSPPKTGGSTPQVKGIQMLGGETFPAGRRITGGLGVSLKYNGNTENNYNLLKNSLDLETTLTFINSSIEWGTDSAHISVDNPKPEASETPYSQTVITGNLYLANRSADGFIQVKYDKPGEGDNVGTAEHPVKDIDKWTNKDVPYLYVDKCFFGQEGMILKNDNDMPFNMICGTAVIGQDSQLRGTNIYLMDEYSDDPTNAYTFKDAGGNAKFTRNRGDNSITFAATNLTKWADSIATGTEVAASAVGGSIFCNGRLTLNFKGNTVDGDVRVEGDCIVDSDITIKGSLIVGGNLTGEEKVTCSDIRKNVRSATPTPGAEPTVAKTVPNKADTVMLTDADFTELDPGATVALNYIRWVPAEHGDVDIFGNPISADENNNSIPRYYKYKDELIYGASFDPNDINVIEGQKYDDIKDNDTFKSVQACLDANTVYIESELSTTKRPINEYDNSNEHYFGVPVAVTADDGTVGTAVSYKPADKNEHYYLYGKGARVVTQAEKEQLIADSGVGGGTMYRVAYDGVTVTADIATSDTTYYVDETTWGYTAAEAIQKAKAKTPAGAGGGTIYPSDMKREAIYVKADGSPADDSTKIITTLTEARDALGLDSMGEVNAKVYKHVYSSTETDVHSVLHPDNNADYAADEKVDISSFMVDAFNKNEWGGIESVNTSKVSIEGTAGSQYYKIKDNCMLSGKLDGVSIAQSLSNSSVKELHIGSGDASVSEINVVLNNCTTDGNLKIIVDGGIHVNFYIVGTFKTTNQQEGVFTSDYLKGTATAPYKFDYTKDWGIVWYGAEKSEIQITNDTSLTGSFKTPYTKIKSEVRGAAANIEYTDEYGKKFVPEGNDTNPYPVIIGNALFEEVSGSNSINNYYTATGADSTPPDSTKILTSSTGNFWDVKYMYAS